MNIRHYILLFLVLLLPGLLPAPDLPPGGDSFSLLDGMRKEIITKDKAKFNQQYQQFKKALAKLESRSNWTEYNRYGFIGKYQFGKSALEATGYGHVTASDFMDDPAVFPESDQEKAMDILLRLNESVMKDCFDLYVGYTVLDTIPLTRAGILAAAHLAGPANVKEFLESFGEKDAKDRMGTRISDYLYQFSR
jgi:hypothetical protein